MFDTSIFTVFPEIKTNKFLLRELRVDDVGDFFTYISDENVKEFLSDDSAPGSLVSARAELGYWRGLFKSKRSIYWGIEIDGKLVGTCGYNNWSRVNRRCEISYDLAYNYWNRGIMTKAIAEISDFALENMGVNRVQATVATDNIGSIKVLEKNNFIREGTLKKFGMLHNVMKDFYMYAKVR